MKIIISAGGKFHSFHLARELGKRGYLEKIFTAFHGFNHEKGVSRGNIVYLPLKEILEWSLSKIPRLGDWGRGHYYLSCLFDQQVSSRISPCDIFVGWSGFSLYTLRKLRKSQPAKIIIERGSTHIEFQRDILIEEGERLGAKLNVPSSLIIDKELGEYKEADYISVPSILAKETFIKKGTAESKIIQVSLGVDINVFKPIPKEDSIFRVIFVGGMNTHKGVHYLLQAVSELRLKNFEVWLIGGINEDIKPFLKRYAGSFKYIGKVPQRQLHRYLSQGSVFVLFSIEDGFGMALLEAMACGLPVICSSNVGAKDAVRDGVDGFILPNRDVEALKEKITYFYEHPEVCREMGRQARANVESNFTWQHYGARIVSKYEQVLKNN